MNKDTSEPPFDYRNKYSVSYSPETGLILKVVRAGREYTDDFRGGTWYQVELWRGQQCTYSSKSICFRRPPGVGGMEEYRKTIRLMHPFYVDISNIKSEGEEPLVLYEAVTGKPASRKGLKGAHAEEYYARIERSIADELTKNGYDGALLYFSDLNVKYPSAVFVVAPSKEKEIDANREMKKQENNVFYPKLI